MTDSGNLTAVDDLLRTDTTKLSVKPTYIEAKMMLVEAYAETYDLDYGPNLIGIAEEERVSNGSLFTHRAKEFRDYDIAKYGISLLQYIDMPRPFIEELKAEAERALKSEISLSGEVKKNLTN